jgi:hypothetical protein
MTQDALIALQIQDAVESKQRFNACKIICAFGVAESLLLHEHTGTALYALKHAHHTYSS